MGGDRDDTGRRKPPYDGALGRYPSAVEKLSVRLHHQADDRKQLLGISRLLRLLSLPARLQHFQRPEATALANSPIQERLPHPDAAELLEECRQHHPRWRPVSIRGLEPVYRRVLKERCEVEIQRCLADEERDTLRRVLSAIALLAPPDAEDVGLAVWAKLVWRFPVDRGFEYSPEQIVAAWAEAVNDRNRVEALGSLQYRSLDSQEVSAWTVAHSVAPWQSLSNAEMIASCYRRQTPVVRCYIARCLSSRGDWPEELLNELNRLAENEAIALSPGQEKHCRRQLRRGWRP